MATRVSDQLSARSTEERALANWPAPVVIWGTLGALWTAFIAFVMIRWVTGPYFTRVPVGADQPPSWMRTTIVIAELLSPIAGIYTVYRMLIRPWRRHGRLTTDGLLVIVFATLWFQDPLGGYVQHWFTYNTYFFNRGSWVNGIPGWLAFGAPGRQVPEPIGFFPFGYMWYLAVAAVAGCWIMRRAQTRWPGIGPVRLIGLCFGVMVVLDFVLEPLTLQRLGLWSYPGGTLTIFPGHYYQFPVAEPLFFGLFCTMVASVRYLKNDRGQTVAERGFDRLKLSPRRGTALRLLALIGFMQTFEILFVNVPFVIIGAHSGAWPRDIQDRSYLTDRVCGPGSARACPGPAIPITRSDTSLYIAPNGRVIVPRGVDGG